MHAIGLTDPQDERDGAVLALELGSFATALRRASAAWREAADELAPPTPADLPDAHRLARARAAWTDGPAPSHEQLAGMLAAVFDASGALVVAARRFDAASEAVEHALRTSRAHGPAVGRTD